MSVSGCCLEVVDLRIFKQFLILVHLYVCIDAVLNSWTLNFLKEIPIFLYVCLCDDTVLNLGPSHFQKFSYFDTILRVRITASYFGKF